MELIGTPVAILFEPDDRSHVIARVRVRVNATDVSDAADDTDTHVAVTGPGDLAPSLRAAGNSSLELRFAGEWTEHPKYGRQFRFATYSPVSPVDRKGMVVYVSNLCQGIGTMRAGRLWDKFGADAVRVLIESPGEAVDAGILTPEIAYAASDRLREEKAIGPVKMELTSLFAGRGFQMARLIKECVTKWGERAAHVVRRNPYGMMLRRMTSASFTRCDKLYTDGGGDPASMKRQALAAEHYFSTSNDGSTWHDAERVMRHVEQHIGPKADAIRAVRLAIRAGRLRLRRVGDERWLALAGQAREETTAAARVEELRSWTRERGTSSVGTYMDLSALATSTLTVISP